MSGQERLFDDAIEKVEGSTWERCVAPRLIMLHDGKYLLVRYGDTRWFGLPGGKMKEFEANTSLNYLSEGSFPTIIREIQEEVNEDVRGYLKESYVACLGITEIVDVRGGRERLVMSPIFVCVTSKPIYEGDGLELVGLNDHLPGPVFPDARLAIERLKRGGEGQIEPEFLNPDGKLIYVNFDGSEPRVMFRR